MSKQGEDLIIKAVKNEDDGNLQSAFDLYQRALGIFLEDLKKETDESKKASIRRIVMNYMTVAENIKKILDESASKPVKSTAKSSAKPTVSSAASKPDYYDYSIPGREVKSKPKPAPFIPTTSGRSITSRINTPNVTSSSASASASANTTATSNATTSKADSKTVSSSSEDSKLSEYETQIQQEMLDISPGVQWDDIAGLAFAKQTLQEAVILPNLRPDLFTGLRAPPKGVLLFGPPGTGKTLLAKAVATESGFSFFSITASSVTSKYLGEGEKLMKSLFNVARRVEPAVIFLDEIDSLMSARKENEHEASRRVKTEFMTQVDGATTGNEERLLIMGATNIPWELDEAVLRRLVKRIYVPLPDADARRALIKHLINKHYTTHKAQQSSSSSSSSSLSRTNSGRQVVNGINSPKSNQSGTNNNNTTVVNKLTNIFLGSDSKSTDTTTSSNSSNNNSSNIKSSTKSASLSWFTTASSDDTVHGFNSADITRIVNITEGYSGSDLTALCHEAAMGPIRELNFAALKTVKAEDVRPLNVKDFEQAVTTIRPSVSPDSLNAYQKWGEQFGVVK